MLQGESISSESEAELMKVFQSLDKKGRGYIGVRELKNMTKSVGQRISKKEIRQMISIADLDGDGKVNYDGKYEEYLINPTSLLVYLFGVGVFANEL